MKSLVKRKSLLAILSTLCASCMLFAGLSVKKASADAQPATLETVTLTTTMENTASMRLTNPTGMRFTANVAESDITQFNADNVKVVVMITQQKLLTEAGLTVDTFDKDSAVTKAEVSFTKDEFPTAENGTIKLIATILEVKDENIAKTYVAKTYITDGEKIGYVANATKASIYEVASYWASQDKYKDNAEAMTILQGYSKSCNVTINGNEAIKVAYYSEVSELFASLPACTTVNSIVDGNSQAVALNAPVTADLALTVEYTVEHEYENGECKHCEEVCEHSWTDGVCTVCGMTCEHTSYKDLLCETCGKVATTTYNNATNASDLKAWQWATSSSKKTNELYQEQVSSAGGKTGNFLRLQVGLAGRTIPSYVGITIAPTITLAELNALKTAGYKSLSVDYYFENDSNSAVKSTFKRVYKNDVFTYEESNPATVVSENVGEWHTLTIDIQKIIDNYDGLVDSTKYIMLIANYSSYNDHSTVFYAYFGNMEFTINTTYSKGDSVDDVQSYGYCTSTGYTSNTGGLTKAMVNEAGGRTGSFIMQRVAHDSSGTSPSNVGITIKPDITLEQLRVLRNAGYKSLSVDYYLMDAHATDKPGYKMVATGDVYTYGEANSGTLERKDHDIWQTFTVDIDKIIANYDGLVSGTKYLLFIRNYTSDGDKVGKSWFVVYFDNMKFI